MKVIDALKKINWRDNTKKITKVDWMIMGIMVLVYGILSFIRLGDTTAPTTYKVFENVDDEVVIKLEDETYVSQMRYYVGYELGDIDVLSSVDNKNYEEVTSLNIGGVFYWADLSVGKDVKYIKLVGKTPGVTLGEIALYNSFDEVITPVKDDDNKLIDEPSLVPNDISFMNSTYFDEIYYGRSAYEYAHGIDAYEWSHPPLGKLIITIPVALFGFSPFAYRFMCNLFGILLIPLMYIFGKKMFKNRKWALLAGLLMMFDTFHFAHTRIALVDGFQVFFIILSAMFMKEYIDLDMQDSFKKKTKYLLLSGTFIGCAIATKWNAFYVGLALAIVFFVHLFKQYDIHLIKSCKKFFNINRIVISVGVLIVIPFVFYYIMFILFNVDVAKIMLYIYYFLAIVGSLTVTFANMFKNKNSSKIIKTVFSQKYLFKLMLVCIVSFILIPVIIYILSYIVVPTIKYYDGTLKGIIDANKMMYDYHANLDATHPFSSIWYQWPIMLRPVWLYSGATKDGLRMTITDIGNPAIWWFGVLAVVYLIINTIKKKNKNDIFILIFVLTTFIPYVFIGRLMFMYHYFITLPFTMLAIVAFIKWITEKTKDNRVYFGYIFLIIFMFIIFYPIVSATPVSSEYIESLKWLPDWYF